MKKTTLLLRFFSFYALRYSVSKTRKNLFLLMNLLNGIFRNLQLSLLPYQLVYLEGSKWTHISNKILVRVYQYAIGAFTVKLLIIRHTLRSEVIFGNWKPFENDEKCFLFHLKSIFVCIGWLFLLKSPKIF